MPISIDPFTFYTVKELAKIMNKSKQTIRRYLYQDKIKSCGIVGREHLIYGEEVLKFLKSGIDAQVIAEKFKPKKKRGK